MMWPETTPVGRIPRTVIRRHTYGYRAEPGHLVVDVAQGDPPVALITNRSGSLLRVDLRAARVGELIQVPGSRLPRTAEEWRELERIVDRAAIPVRDGDSLALVFGGEAHGAQRYEATVDGTGIEVSGGSGPDIIIEP
jgi:hypothetical protein